MGLHGYRHTCSQQSANIDCRYSIAAHRVFEIRPARAKDCDLDTIPHSLQLAREWGLNCPELSRGLTTFPPRHFRQLVNFAQYWRCMRRMMPRYYVWQAFLAHAKRGK